MSATSPFIELPQGSLQHNLLSKERVPVIDQGLEIADGLQDGEGKQVLLRTLAKIFLYCNSTLYVIESTIQPDPNAQ